VRPEFRNADPAKGRAFLGGGGERILLVLGGSQGARDLNRLVERCLPGLTEYYTVVHQIGRGNGEAVSRGRYRAYPYLGGELPHLLAAAELVLGRSGAGTIWEAAAVGRPMVLIPLCGPGTRGDQVENARFFERAGAAAVLLGEEASPENLLRVVAGIAGDAGRRDAMAAASRRIGETDGAACIAASIVRFMGEHS
jgi:UDP-N-acetylglucosamine--N-acetylmuramyl-(pentapeptide) pyrophosphoryl-undecaprenol N-acetylglucosamine transferase